MINSVRVFEVMSSFRYFAAMLLGFDGLLSLIELEGFSPDMSDVQMELGEFLMVLPRFGNVYFLWTWDV